MGSPALDNALSRTARGTPSVRRRARIGHIDMATAVVRLAHGRSTLRARRGSQSSEQEGERMARNRWLCVSLAALVFLGTSTPLARGEQAVYPEPPPKEQAAALAIAGDVLFTAPGKFVTCVGSIALWAATMAVTRGTMYGDAAKLVIGGCGGEWVATGKDIRDAVVQPER